MWPLLQRLLDDPSPPQPKGPRRMDRRRVFHGLIVGLRTGGQGTRLPAAFGDDSPMPRHCQRWGPCGLFARLWAVRSEAGEDWEGVDWEGQAADTMLGTARMGGAWVGRTPTARGQKG